MQEFDKKLSDKIKQELGAFEPEFNPAHWNGMRQQLAATKKLFWLRLLSVVGVVTILGAICAWYFLCSNLESSPLVAQQKKEIGVAKVSPSVILKTDSVLNQRRIARDSNTLEDKGTMISSASVLATDKMGSEQGNISTENTNAKSEGINQSTDSKEVNASQTYSDIKKESDNNAPKINAILSQRTEEETREALINKNDGKEENKKVVVENTTENNEEKTDETPTIYTVELLPEDSLNYYIWENAIPNPSLTIIPKDSIENKATEPAAKFQLGFLIGASLLNAESSNALGVHFASELNYYLQKRVFVQASVGYQVHTLKTSNAAYIPSPLPSFTDDTLSLAPPLSNESEFREFQYESSPLAYKLPAFSLTTSVGYHLYQSKKLNVFATLGISNYLWGKVSVVPYTANTGANTDDLYIASSLESTNIVGNYPVEYPAFRHADLFAAWQTQWGTQYKINNKLAISSSVSYEGSFYELSPAAFKINRFGIKSGLVINFK